MIFAPGLFSSHLKSPGVESAAPMTVFRQFELEAIRLMAKDVLSDSPIAKSCEAFRDASTPKWGYFGTLSHAIKQRNALHSTPFHFGAVLAPRIASNTTLD